jgi:amino acid transporter
MPQTSPRPPRTLRFWGAIGISFGLMGPTLAMAGNGQGAVDLVGKSVPLVYVLAAVGVGLIGYGFVRLGQRYDGKGSAYSLVGQSIGPRAGLFSGLLMMVAYVLFTIGTAAVLASFVNAFLAEAQSGSAHPFQVPWVIPPLIALALSAYLNTKDLKMVVTILLAIEGFGILGMSILTVVIFSNKAMSPGGVDFSVFTFGGVHAPVIMSAITAAVLSWAGFEGCAAIASETKDARRNIPRALLWIVGISSIIFVLVMFAQTIGFGTTSADLKQFSGSSNSLTTLGQRYVGVWFSLIISFTAVMSAFSCQLSASATSSRLLAAFAEDGIGPRVLAHRSPSGQSDIALWSVLVVAAAALITAWSSGHPVMGTGDPALDSYLYFAIMGVTMIIIVYAMVDVGSILHVWKDLPNRRFETVLPVVGIALLAAAIYYSAIGQTNWVNPTYLGLGLASLALIFALLSPSSVAKVRASLRKDEADRTDERAASRSVAVDA